MSKSALKQKIARQFSRAASRYDAAAEVQKQISSDAISHLHPNYNRLLDIGCGTGLWHQTLAQRTEQLFACDLAEGMVQFAYSRQAKSHANYLVADAEKLPLQDASLDGVFSSMALQWCDDIQAVFNEIYRVLKPKGHAVLAILCDGAMHELNQAWLDVDQYRHTNPFYSHHRLMQAGTDAGFLLTAEQKDYVCWHSNIRALLSSIKQIGANVLTQTEAKQPLTRDSLEKLEQAYFAAFGQDHKLPLTYSASLLSLTKPS